MARWTTSLWGILFLPILLCAQDRARRLVPVSPEERSEFRGASKFAVLVGVGNYPRHSRLGMLAYPGRDVDLIEVELKRHGYAVVSLKDQEATREAVRGTLLNLEESLRGTSNASVIFYFSGHGWAPNGRNTLATFDAGALNLESSGLTVAEVVTALGRTGARRRMLWIDACRDQPEPGQKSVGTRSFAMLDRAEGTRIFYSTKLGSPSYENNELRQGVFSHFLVTGLRGAAAKADGLISMQDLAEFVTRSVREYTFQRGTVQLPFEGGEFSGDFLLASILPVTPVTPVVSATPPSQTPGTLATIASPVPATLPPSIRTPGPSRVPTRKASEPSALTCSVRETPRGAWSDSGTAQFLMDNEPIGTVRFSAAGSRTLRFPCTPGTHRFELRVSLRDGAPIYCEQTLQIDDRRRYLDFGAQVGFFGKGRKCSILLVE